MALNPYDAAVELLGAAEAALGADTPATRLVTLDVPPIDCEILVVSGFAFSVDEALAGGTGAGPAASGVRVGNMMSRFTMMVLAAWEVCDKGPNLDADAAAEDASKIISRGWVLWRAVTRHRFDDCRARSVGPAVPLDVAGGYAGWRIPVDVQVDGD